MGLCLLPLLCWSRPTCVHVIQAVQLSAGEVTIERAAGTLGLARNAGVNASVAPNAYWPLPETATDAGAGSGRKAGRDNEGA